MKKKLLFIHIPKTAGTSISKSLNIPKDHGHRTLQKIISKKSELNKYYKVAFVRNPYDRMVSLYNEKKETGWLYKNVDFKKFIQFIYTDISKISNDPNLENHSKPCTFWLKYDEQIIMDYIGKFENIENDLNFIYKTLNLDNKKLQHLRKRNKMHYSKYYDEETINIVKKYHKEDLELFNYKFTYK
jgi:chondroitin 4-sulfotransferase 11